MPETCSLPELFNRLQALYDRYDGWDNRLKELVQSEGSIQSLLDASFPIFRNPLLLRAADFFMLSYSSIIDEKPELAHLIDPNSSFETLTTSRLDPEYNEARNYTEPFYLPAVSYTHLQELELLQEYLSPSLGVQAQLPVLLCEYAFRTKQDILDYLALLKEIPDYFARILEFEQEKAANGYFMNDLAADGVIAQCSSFIEDPENLCLCLLYTSRCV